MDSQMMIVSAAILVLMATCTCALPSDNLQSSDLSADKRPKYMDTRDLDIFKYMLMASIRDLVEEGQLNPGVLAGGAGEEEPEGELKGVAKRMQYMGICMRRRQNTFIPYPCLRSGSK